MQNAFVRTSFPSITGEAVQHEPKLSNRNVIEKDIALILSRSSTKVVWQCPKEGEKILRVKNYG